MRKVNNCKSSRLTPTILKLANHFTSIKNIAKEVSLSEATVKKVLICEGYNIGSYNKKVKRYNLDEYILFEAKKNDKTYREIAVKYGVTERRVRNILTKNGFRRNEKRSPEKYKSMVNNIIHDINNGTPIKTLKDKYNLNDPNIYATFRRYGLPPIAKTYRDIRDKEITRQYKTNIARVVLKSDAVEMDSPVRLQNIGGIYRSSSRNGFKKYPKIGERYKGGLFVEPEVIKIIKREKSKKKTHKEIAELLNNKGFISPMGNPYNQYMVGFKWAKIKKLKL